MKRLAEPRTLDPLEELVAACQRFYRDLAAEERERRRAELVVDLDGDATSPCSHATRPTRRGGRADAPAPQRRTWRLEACGATSGDRPRG